MRRGVCEPAGIDDTEFLRSHELPGGVALRCIPDEGPWRTKVFHLPVCVTDDGAIYSTVADLHRLWTTMLDGRIGGPDLVVKLIERSNDAPKTGAATGWGSG